MMQFLPECFLAAEVGVHFSEDYLGPHFAKSQKMHDLALKALLEPPFAAKYVPMFALQLHTN